MVKLGIAGVDAFELRLTTSIAGKLTGLTGWGEAHGDSCSFCGQAHVLSGFEALVIVIRLLTALEACHA